MARQHVAVAMASRAEESSEEHAAGKIHHAHCLIYRALWNVDTLWSLLSIGRDSCRCNPETVSDPAMRPSLVFHLSFVSISASVA